MSHQIKVVKYKEDVWNTNEKVRNYINNYFESEVVKNIEKSPEANGVALSTAGLPGNWILESDELKPLVSWIVDEIKKAYVDFYNQEVDDINFVRVWSNKMYENSSGAWHTHYSADVVGIFYLNVPDNGAYLITETENIMTTNGDLVMHKGDLPHSVSEHKSDEPRIVLVFDTIGV